MSVGKLGSVKGHSFKGPLRTLTPYFLTYFLGYKACSSFEKEMSFLSLSLWPWPGPKRRNGQGVGL